MINNWRPFLNISAAESGTAQYSIYHQTVAAFLNEEEGGKGFQNLIIDAALSKR
jgi:hypothetical protein